MKSLPVVLTLLGLLSGCSADQPTASTTHSIASNLSDKDGKLARTFLYLIDGDSVRQRECQVAAPQGVQDCGTLRASKKLTDFRRELESDISLSRTRLRDALVLLQKDAGALSQRLAELNSTIQKLQTAINQGSTPSGEDVGQLQAALNFAQTQRDRLNQQLQVERDPQKRQDLQQNIAAFDQQIADLKNRIAAAQGGGNIAELKKQLAEAQASQSQVTTDLNNLNKKIETANAQKLVVDEESRILTATLEKLKATAVFDARDVAFNSTQAEKQLSSRFHKLFQSTGPDCTPPAVNALKELATGEGAILTSREAQVGGAWHAGELIRQLLGGNPTPAQVETFFRNFLQNWQVETRISSGDTVAARPDISQVVNEWKQASQNRGVNGLDLSVAPLRLIGITNRLDLRNRLVNGDAGEMRLAFALLENSTDRPQANGLQVRPFTLIFEYKVSVGDDSALSRWAGFWHELGSLPCSPSNCDSYVNRLAQITRMVTHRQGGFVQGQLGQLRTNEIAFGNPWEQREFNLQPAAGGANARLVAVDVKRTPKQSANGTQELNRFIASVSLDDLTKNAYEIPAGMRGIKGQVLPAAPQWTANVDAAKARIFNLNTCNGCHSSDQAVIDGFYHLSPFQALGQASMSSHLKDEELPRRARNLASFLVDPSCTAGTPFDARLSLDAPLSLSRPVH